MDIALAIEALVPAADYRGSTTANTREAFDKLVWMDARAKPAWAEIEALAITIAAAATMRLFEETIEAHIEATATERGYAGSTRIATYVASTKPAWKAEAEAFLAWRDDIWEYAFAELASVQAGDRDEPTIEAFIAELPAITWPA